MSKETKPPKPAPKIINGVIVDNVLLAEQGSKYRADFTPQMCVDELRRVGGMAAEHDLYLSRRFFRNNSIISDGTWDRYFGTFEEFKRRGGIDLPRGAHRLELNIARHASKDTYRSLNIDKSNWGQAYLKPSGKRFQTILGFNDTHDIMIDPFYERLLIETAKRLQPDVLCLNGDGLDLPEFGKYNVDPRSFDPMARLAKLHALCGALREACPDAEFVYVEGNHEFRWLRFLADAGVAGTAMKVILSELHGMSVADFFGLTKFEINYVSRSDLSADNASDIKRELKRNYHVFHDCVLACHYPDAINLAMPGWNGHHHSHRVETRSNPFYGQYEWHQFGSGHARRAEYTDGEKWSNGFGIIHVDTLTKSSVTEYIDIKDFCCIGGQYYERADSEKLNNPRRLAA